VDGVYSADPEKDPNAIHHPQLTYMDVLSRDLGVMDASAISLARENEIPMIVFSIEKQGSFGRVLRHEDKFTLITDE
jgi:uridylate kinase